ncbi:MAG: hypothetical protein ACOZFS_04045 [Thermodesulfobacteriota bacterium]
MSVKEAVLSALKELVLPELAAIKQEQVELKLSLVANNQRIDDVGKRLDDMNAHLVDQSRRIDAVREELGGRIDTVREELAGRIDTVREELAGRIDAVREGLNRRLDTVREGLGGRIDAVREGLGGRIDAVREELGGRIDETNGRIGGVISRIDEINQRLDRLYEVIVRREEHHDLAARVRTLEQEMADLKKRFAA